MLPHINTTIETNNIIKFLKYSVSTRNYSKVIVAVSGGIDSGVSLALATKACGINNVYPLLMPYGEDDSKSTRDALLLIKKNKIPKNNVEIVNITSSVDVIRDMLDLNVKKRKNLIRIGNIMARVRMITLYDRVKKYSAIVIGTENKSEYYLGYFTRFGDEASDIEPIRHLYKTQIYQIAEKLSIPKQMLKKAPSAELWHGQTDEKEFGFTYKQADQILFGLYEKKLTVGEMVKQGFSEKDVTMVSSWVKKNSFKHELPFSYHGVR